MLTKIRRVFVYARENGIQITARKLAGKFVVFFKILLRRVFGFDAWHVSSFMDRPYAHAVVDFLNSRPKRASVVEVGCGLGDILRHLNYKDRLGLDRSQEVLRAARVMAMLSPKLRRHTTFHTFDFLGDDLSGQFDAIILVNWIHEIEPAALKGSIDKLFSKNLRADGVIVFDVLNGPGYRYSHSVVEISRNLPCKIVPVGDFDFSRRIFALEREIDLK